MAKAKLDLKGFLLKRGEHLAMGFAGFLLVVFLIYGASKWTSAQDPTDTVRKFQTSAQNVYTGIDKGTPDANDKSKIELAPWIKVKPGFAPARTDEFGLSGPLFDPTGTPNTKRENPTVFGIRENQIDMIRGAMTGYDIVDVGGEPAIAMITTKAEGKLDGKKLSDAQQLLRSKLGAKGAAQPKAPQPKGPGGPIGPGGPMGPGGSLGPTGGPGGSGTGTGGSLGPTIGGSGGGVYGNFGGDLSQDGQRVEKAIEYVKLKEIDKALKDGKVPALTVIPLRLVTIHAVVPYKAQLAELKRALRLNSDADARIWGPWYDGYEVQRRVSKFIAGEWKVVQDWPEKPLKPDDTSGNYKFEEKYIEKIDTRKVADHFDEGYIPYFLKPEYMLAMPLPALAKDLNVKYPEIKLKDIDDNIEKLRKADLKVVSPSDFAQRVNGTKPKSSLYKNQSSQLDRFGLDDGQFGTLGPGALQPGGMGPMLPMPGPGGPGALQPPTPGGTAPGRPLDGFGVANTTEREVENFLLRFVDCDVEPGYRYEYRVRLRMLNPNYKQDALVAVPEYAKDAYKVLFSNWIKIDRSVEVPAESFLYAHDVKTYREATDSALKDQKELLAKVQVKDHQAVLQTVTWMAAIRLDNSSNREPVGTWVVAETPVSRGEYIGRKQYVKLPLWSSAASQYQLREVTDKVLPKAKEQPKGWLVDFTPNKSILVDFEGGRVKGKSAYRFDAGGQLIPQPRDKIEDDAATELLILRPDGKVVVRNSAIDEADENRKTIATEWARWVGEVEKRKPVGAPVGGPGGEFGRKE